ncbi:DUF6210 family protein [Planctomicrobium sp.]|jgi:hypothetical protein|nr:DUF6210 family protein [Planctomicrobium sp.]MDB4732957.1 DUF6210 family protein [Planctomicrobium sp.]
MIKLPIVELYSTVGTALILDYPSGIEYTNQAGGIACHQPVVQGVLIPFENDYDLHGRFVSLEVDLATYFKSTYGGCGATEEISVGDADEIDGLLRQRKLIEWFHVDRNKLHLSFESWIFVTVLLDHPFYCQGFGPYPRVGVLTWANSD